MIATNLSEGKFGDNNLVRVTATWLSLQRSEPSVTLTRLSSGLVFDMSGTIPALMETNSVWRGIFGLQPHSSISLLQNRHMENCGALVSPSTCCCSALPCRGSRSWRLPYQMLLYLGTWEQLESVGWLTTTTLLVTCCLDGIDARIEELHFRGVNFIFIFVTCNPPHTHTLTLGFVVDLYWLIYSLDHL